MKKVIFVVVDGMSDRPIEEFKRKTPLEMANTPNMDKLAQKGISGAMNTIDIGVRAGSDTAHLALFGYDPYTYYTGRGPFEAAGLGMNLEPGDICFRTNMGTVNKDMVVIDRRAGRINSTHFIADILNETMIDGVKFLIKGDDSYRMALVMRGKNLSPKITDGDPHEDNVKVHTIEAKEDSFEAKFTAKVLNKFLEFAHEKIKDAEENVKREKEGKFPANYLLVRGPGIYPNLPSFKDKYGLKACGIAASPMYKGIAKALGMDVPRIAGTTGKPNSDLMKKVEAVKERYDKYDFFFVHVKGTDPLSHDGDFEGKRKFLEEKVDPMVGEMMKIENTLIVLTADHTTPCELKNHSADDVPVTIYAKSVRDDDVVHFNERECAKGRLGHIKGMNLMPIIIDLMGLASMYGA